MLIKIEILEKLTAVKLACMYVCISIPIHLKKENRQFPIVILCHFF